MQRQKHTCSASKVHSGVLEMTWDRPLINGRKLYSKLQMSKDPKKRENQWFCATFVTGLNDVQRTDGMDGTGQYKRHSFYPWDQMTSLQTTEQMLWFPTKFQQAAGMEMNNKVRRQLHFFCLFVEHLSWFYFADLFCLFFLIAFSTLASFCAAKGISSLLKNNLGYLVSVIQFSSVVEEYI